MARYLYRLGCLAARRAWLVLLAWLLLLALVAGGAHTLGRPFTSKMTIPGTEFQRVIDDLETSLPKAAGGMGVVVFSTSDGQPFTAAQREAVAAVTAEWAKVSGVDSAMDPFATQQQLDEGAAKVAGGKDQLAKGKAELAAQEAKLAQAQADIDAGQKKLDASAQQITDGEKALVDAKKQLDDGQKAYDEGATKQAAGEQQYTTAKQQADAAAAPLRAAQADIAAQQKKIDDGRAQIAAAQAKVTALQQQLAALSPLDPKAIDLRFQLLTAQGALDDAKKQQPQLDQQQQAVDAAKAKLAPDQAKADAATAQLAATRGQLDDGQKQLAAAKAKLDDGKATFQANQTKLVDGKAELEKGKTDLAAAKAQLADGQKQLAAAKAAMPANEAQLALAQRRIALMDGLRAVNSGGDVAVTQITFTQPINEVPQSTRTAVPEKARALADAGVDVDYSKDIVQNLTSFGPGELVGVIAAAVVLIVMLGSLLAAGLPLLTALIGVGVGLLSAVALTHWVDMTDVTPALALMLGLAVGIDYALFLVNRHREQIAAGMPLHESIGRATGTAGSAVLVAGLTVIVALCALALTGIPFLATMGFVAAGTVAVAVAVSLTLTPALLAILGPRVLPLRARLAMRREARAARADEAAGLAADTEVTGRPGAGVTSSAGGRTIAVPAYGQGRFEQDTQMLDDLFGPVPEGATGAPAPARERGWGVFVTRHPILVLLAATALLSFLALPARSLSLGLPDGGYEPRDSTAYRAYHLVDTQFGAGRNGPIIAVAKLDEARAHSLTPDQLTDLQITVGEKLRAVPDVAYVVPAMASDDHRTLVYQVVPKTGPSDDATSTLVTDLRSARDQVVRDQGLESLGYAGQTVANIDISRALADALPIYLVVVVGISLLLLLLVFRSIVVPVLATVGFLLSVAAAFGCLVAVYQWGWLGVLFGVERPGLVLSFLPTLVIGILFGLAMDYQMFLVTGMRESWVHGQPARAAVRSGFDHGARVVTAAALIMTAVFGSFVHAELAMIRPIGFALAMGVLLDAFVVRMTAIPAVMHLLGERAWWIPEGLDRVLPHVDVEGATLERSEVTLLGAQSPQEEPVSAAVGAQGRAGAASAAAGGVGVGVGVDAPPPSGRAHRGPAFPLEGGEPGAEVSSDWSDQVPQRN